MTYLSTSCGWARIFGALQLFGVIRGGQKSANLPAKVASFLSTDIYKPFGGRFEALAVSQTIWHGKTEMLEF